MTQLPLDPARCEALSHGIDQIVATSGCDTFEVFAVLLANALNHGRTLPSHHQAQLIRAVTDALTDAAPGTMGPRSRRRLDA